MSNTGTTAPIDNTIRPFKFRASDAALADLKRRITATKWPSKELVATQGVQLATMQKLATYWAANHDWRKVESRLDALPQFVTNIEGVDIHFIHVRSKHPDALPVIITYGWPGSIIEQLKLIDPLTDGSWRKRVGRPSTSSFPRCPATDFRLRRWPLAGALNASHVPGPG